MPYSDTGGRWQTMEYPVVIGYFAYGSAVVTQALSGLPDLDVRRSAPADASVACLASLEESRRYFQVTALLLAPFVLLAGMVPRSRPPRPALGRRRVRAQPGPGADRPGQLGRARGHRRRGCAVGVVPGPAPAGRRADRAGHRHQALPVVPARRAARGVRASRPAAGLRSGDRSVPSAAWLLVNLPTRALRPRRVEGVLVLQRRARRRPRLALAGLAAERARGQRLRDQRRVLDLVRRGLRRRRGARPARLPHPSHPSARAA